MKRFLVYFGSAAATMTVLMWVFGFYVNTTRSIPLGVYRKSEGPIGYGSYVTFCPPKSDIFDTAQKRGYISAGFCPSGYGYIMKRVAAASGDVVSVADEGVRVNGVLLPLSAPQLVDKAGRPMPRQQGQKWTLAPAEYLLMSNISPISFDGRYYGPVSAGQIRDVIQPVWTW
ncbi:MAG: conjugative transfer signal peptidase TraF [Alphaproteobacteria bacterium]|nr:conjugative transfer signal peptidase TraF [Alphaproteobacteria bacterium]